jgi:hypothetical protein
MINQAQRAQQQNRAQASPTGTACLIGKTGLLEHVVKRFGARSCSPWGAKTSQMGVSNPATPKYEISRPNIPPNVRNSEHNHPPATSGIVYMYLLVPLPLLNSPAPLRYPALSSGTLGISTILPAHPKNPITNPNQPRHHGNIVFFWVVGFVPYAFMK